MNFQNVFVINLKLLEFFQIHFNMKIFFLYVSEFIMPEIWQKNTINYSNCAQPLLQLSKLEEVSITVMDIGVRNY